MHAQIAVNANDLKVTATVCRSQAALDSMESADGGAEALQERIREARLQKKYFQEQVKALDAQIAVITNELWVILRGRIQQHRDGSRALPRLSAQAILNHCAQYSDPWCGFQSLTSDVFNGVENRQLCVQMWRTVHTTAAVDG